MRLGVLLASCALASCSLLAPDRDELVGTRPGPAGTGGSAGAGGCGTLSAKGTFPTQSAPLDDFAQADGPPSSSWLGDLNEFVVDGGELLATSTSAVETGIWWAESACADQEAFVTLRVVDGAADETFLRLKQQDLSPCNNIEVVYKQGEVRVRICGPGTNTTLVANSFATLQDGDAFGARARASGQVEVYVNGALVLEADVGPDAGSESWAHHAAEGRIGLGVTGGSGVARFDDFGGG